LRRPIARAHFAMGIIDDFRSRDKKLKHDIPFILSDSPASPRTRFSSTSVSNQTPLCACGGITPALSSATQHENPGQHPIKLFQSGSANVPPISKIIIGTEIPRITKTFRRATLNSIGSLLPAIFAFRIGPPFRLAN
jgi:hypothetical protein